MMSRLNRLNRILAQATIAAAGVGAMTAAQATGSTAPGGATTPPPCSTCGTTGTPGTVNNGGQGGAGNGYGGNGVGNGYGGSADVNIQGSKIPRFTGSLLLNLGTADLGATVFAPMQNCYRQIMDKWVFWIAGQDNSRHELDKDNFDKCKELNSEHFQFVLEQTALNSPDPLLRGVAIKTLAAKYPKSFGVGYNTMATANKTCLEEGGETDSLGGCKKKKNDTPPAPPSAAASAPAASFAQGKTPCEENLKALFAKAKIGQVCNGDYKPEKETPNSCPRMVCRDKLTKKEIDLTPVYRIDKRTADRALGKN